MRQSAGNWQWSFLAPCSGCIEVSFPGLVRKAWAAFARRVVIQLGTFSLLIFVFGILLHCCSLAARAESPQELLDAGRVDETIKVLDKQIHTLPTPEAYNLLCRAYFELDDWDAGIPACEKAVSLAPDSGLYHLWLGRIYGEKADHVNFLKAAGLAGKVRREFERAVQLMPDSWAARTDLAEFYLEAPGIVGGGEDKARAEASDLMGLDPGMAHWVLARIAEKKKNWDEAEREYRAEIAASHGGARAWVNLAGFYRHVNRVGDMVQALRTMEKQPLDRPAALMDGANLLLRNGRDYPLAIQLVQQYLSSAPDEEWPAFKAHEVLGELLEKQGNRKAAADQYRAALAMAHDFKRAQEELKQVES
jgi:tetratricopeptide (TPR) repeat protein